MAKLDTILRSNTLLLWWEIALFVSPLEHKLFVWEQLEKQKAREKVKTSATRSKAAKGGGKTNSVKLSAA